MGCVLPVLPGHLIILIAAVSHRLMLGPESGLAWWSFVILGAADGHFPNVRNDQRSRRIEVVRRHALGALGAIAGSIVGMFFLPFGLLLGPLIGAFVCEIAVAKKQSHHAAISGVGSVVGTLAGMGFKIAVGVLMIGWFLLDVFLIGSEPIPVGPGGLAQP